MAKVGHLFEGPPALGRLPNPANRRAAPDHFRGGSCASISRRKKLASSARRFARLPISIVSAALRLGAAADACGRARADQPPAPRGHLPRPLEGIGPIRRVELAALQLSRQSPKGSRGQGGATICVNLLLVSSSRESFMRCLPLPAPCPPNTLRRRQPRRCQCPSRTLFH
jgi:hypothetical protein